EGGRPLVPALASTLGLTEAQVRRFRGLTPQRLGPFPGLDTLRLCAQLPPHLWPSSRKQWRAAIMAIGAATFVHDGQVLPPDLAASLFRGVRGPIELVDPSRSLSTLRDPLIHLRHAPAHGPAMIERVAAMNLTQLVRLTREWHRRHVQATVAAQAVVAAQLRDAPSWPGTVDPAVASALPGVVVRELVAPEQL